MEWSQNFWGHRFRNGTFGHCKTTWTPPKVHKGRNRPLAALYPACQSQKGRRNSRGPSGLPAPIQEQANRGFEPPVFLHGFLAAGQQSHALWCTGDKNEEMLGQKFRVAK